MTVTGYIKGNLKFVNARGSFVIDLGFVSYQCVNFMRDLSVYLKILDHMPLMLSLIVNYEVEREDKILPICVN